VAMRCAACATGVAAHVSTAITGGGGGGGVDLVEGVGGGGGRRLEAERYLRVLQVFGDGLGTR